MVKYIAKRNAEDEGFEVEADTVEEAIALLKSDDFVGTVDMLYYKLDATVTYEV